MFLLDWFNPIYGLFVVSSVFENHPTRVANRRADIGPCQIRIFNESQFSAFGAGLPQIFFSRWFHYSSRTTPLISKFFTHLIASLRRRSASFRRRKFV
jgi:hypothetical protein